MKKTLTSLTEKGDNRMDELCNSIYEELTPDNTIGDFFSELLTRAVTETIGEDVMNMTLGELMKEPSKAMLVNERVFKSDWFDIFGKIDNPAELMA